MRLFVFLLCLALWPRAIFADGAGNDSAKHVMPANFPELTANHGTYWLQTNGNGLQSDFTVLASVNGKLLEQLRRYTPESISVVFGERMKHERNVHLKLVLAAYAAANGNQEAKTFILGLRETVDYAITISRISALKALLYERGDADWVVDALHDTLTDQRRVTGRHPWSHDPDVSDTADQENVANALSHAKHPRSVPVLIRLLEDRRHARSALLALTDFRDPRAIPSFMKLLAKEEQAIQFKETAEKSPSQDLTRALAKLKVTDAVPALLKYATHSEDVIIALGEIGDDRAIELLSEIVRHGGKREGETEAYPRQFQRRLFAAEMALIKIRAEHRLSKLVELLGQPTLDKYQRAEVVTEIGQANDESTIPVLIELLQNHPEDPVVRNSVRALAQFKRNAVVKGLIGGFSNNRWPEHGGKAQLTSSDFAWEIGRALKEATGKDFGSDQAKWEQWWETAGRFDTKLE